MRRHVAILMTITAIATLSLFQNCAPTQNYDLEQMSQNSLGGAGAPNDAAPVGDEVMADPTPTPVPTATPEVQPTPTPTPTPTPGPGPGTRGAYCPFPATNMPKLKASFIDLHGVNLSENASINSMLARGTPLDGLNVYYESLNFGTVDVASHLTVNGASIRRDGEPALKDSFLVEYEGYLQLSSGAVSQTYQIGAAATGHLSVEVMLPGTTSFQTLIEQKSDLSGSRFLCGGQMFLRISDQVKIRVRQVHGSGEKLSLGLYLRPSKAESASCGWVGDLFSGLNPVTVYKMF